MATRLAWIPAFFALLLAQGASALVLLGDDRWVRYAHRYDPYDPAVFDETYRPDSFFGPLSFANQGSSFSIAADGLGFDGTAILRSSAWFGETAPNPEFALIQSSFEIVFRIDGAGRIDLAGTTGGSSYPSGDARASLTGPDGEIYSYSFNPYGPSPFGFHAPLPAGEYVLALSSLSSSDEMSGWLDVTLAVRDTAVPIVVPFVCDNGLDDDGDLLADFPDDPGCESPGGATEDHVPACSNGADDDGDTLADHPADPGCASALDESELAVSRCDNGVDDDADGAADYPADSDCTSPSEDAELTPSNPRRWVTAAGGNAHAYEFVSEGDVTWNQARIAATLRKPPPGYGPGHLASIASFAENEFLWGLQFFNGEAWIGFTDEEVEGEWRWIDDTPGVWQDPGTFPNPVQTVPYVNWTSGAYWDYAVFPTEDYPYFDDRWSSDEGTKPAYFVEWEPAGLVCDDGIDEDGDGLVDFPADPGCTSAADPDEGEASFACDDGLDNDYDFMTDYAGGDPGCPFPTASPENPPCDDWDDNDGDGAYDFEDTWCSLSWPYWESPPCGVGAELVFVLLPIGWLGARRRRAA
jgi:hypothetical protein